MNILLLGSGGREHALAWKIRQSPRCSQLFIAPGNAGTASCGTNVQLSLNDFESIRKLVIEHDIKLVIVGPEEPLVNGIRNFFSQDSFLKKIPLIGPGKEGAQLEGSKAFAKEFMQLNGIPTAAYNTFTKENLPGAFRFLESLKAPYVIKADGLAGGKGVVIANSLETAKRELELMLRDSKFGAAGNTVVIEEFLDGIELSYFVLTDGTSYKILPEAKDYKRIGDADTGPNTGGMGAVSPVPFADKEFLERVENRIVIPTLKGLKIEGIDYCGFIFIGLMNVNGDPFVIEYNVRMGDPETEVVIPRISSDIVELFEAAASGNLDSYQLVVDPRTALTVMLVSGGYPEKYSTGKEISGLDKLKEELVFHAGTSGGGKSPVLTSGGRVIAVTSLADSISAAREMSYKKIEQIKFEGMNFRKDIGKDLMK